MEYKTSLDTQHIGLPCFIVAAFGYEQYALYHTVTESSYYIVQLLYEMHYKEKQA